MANETPVYGTVLLKASNIINVIAKSSEPLALNTIAQECGYTVSTTSKILDTLQLIEYVQRNPVDKKFSLGIALIQYSNAALMQFDIIRDSYFALKALFDEFHETVHLGMLKDNQMLYINKFSSPENNKQMLSQIGGTRELYCSAMGKAILSTFSIERQKAYIDTIHLTPFTNQTITDKSILTQEIQLVRQQGFATDNREIENHLYCIGAAIHTANEPNAQYAFSVTIPYYRLTDELKQTLINRVLETKELIEKMVL
ncbi:IclR family transcriptional regulator [Tuanshanicoccus lijuaniae]|uniref:IclR family transcriptional regulator n=1 Tax=Aerococcaceae bacterium zg-1292 TaxID=2774330 RepID=UPI001BD8B257|nr:IclR family transcriptional regulator [Aerococcaceae bacterium zg-BR9]MBF6979223.1 IclR family transcriptional regulator [Aerococcaceae bacterium zg-BR22]MBS4455700.1 IclR family transcriptional regulator [Aerococcaceae bacterium zg-A91]MBS4457451.1 IclR family transcriptional regulator [Aerococcaceae bacterium zg-BR33]